MHKYTSAITTVQINRCFSSLLSHVLSTYFTLEKSQAIVQIFDVLYFEYNTSHEVLNVWTPRE